jgi:hypothetical protein
MPAGPPPTMQQRALIVRCEKLSVSMIDLRIRL